MIIPQFITEFIIANPWESLGIFLFIIITIVHIVNHLIWRLVKKLFCKKTNLPQNSPQEAGPSVITKPQIQPPVEKKLTKEGYLDLTK